jgi:hypothetical protein
MDGLYMGGWIGAFCGYGWVNGMGGCRDCLLIYHVMYNLSVGLGGSMSL